MLNLILRWLINAAALIIASQIVPGFQVRNLYAALVAALVLGIINAVIRPILIILTLPINILTLGIFTFIINAALILLVGTVVKGFDIANFSAALLGAIILWAVSIISNAIFKS